MITKTKTKAVQKPRWSEDDIEPPCYHHDDEDTATLTVGEQRRIQGYYANAQRKWRNADEDNDQRVVAAAQAIVRAIRREFETETKPAAVAAPPPCVSSVFWTTPWLIASGDEPVFEPEYEAEYPDYEEHEESSTPVMNRTKEERDKKSTQFKFGLCANCDAGLSDKSEFMGPIGDFVCNACNDYYARLAQPRACGGCN
jgi:hypothetical protein